MLNITLDDQDHTAECLRRGTVLAAVTSLAQPTAGCNAWPLGAMRCVATASPSFMVRHFSQGVDAEPLASAPSLVFNHKDTLQARWGRERCQQPVDLPRRNLPSPQAFVTAALAGMGLSHAVSAAARVALLQISNDAPVCAVKARSTNSRESGGAKVRMNS